MDRFKRARSEPLYRFKVLVGAVLIVLALGNGFTIWAVQHEAKLDRMRIETNVQHDCEQMKKRAVETGKALSKLVEAHTADGSTHAAEVWRNFRITSQENPPPQC